MEVDTNRKGFLGLDNKESMDKKVEGNKVCVEKPMESIDNQDILGNLLMLDRMK